MNECRCKLLESLVLCLPSIFVCFQANGDWKHSGEVALGSPRDKCAANPSPPVNVAVCIRIQMSHAGLLLMSLRLSVRADSVPFSLHPGA